MFRAEIITHVVGGLYIFTLLNPGNFIFAPFQAFQV